MVNLLVIKMFVSIINKIKYKNTSFCFLNSQLTLPLQQLIEFSILPLLEIFPLPPSHSFFSGTALMLPIIISVKIGECHSFTWALGMQHKVPGNPLSLVH